MKKIGVQSDSPQLTRLIAGKFASKISKIKLNSAKVVTLKGDLGSGKTTFVLGFLNYFGIRPHAASPTFVIMKSYKRKGIRAKGIEGIYHLDAYRLRSKKDLEALEFNKILKNPTNIILIEWPERINGMRFKNKAQINFSYGKKENERTLMFSQ